MPHHGDKQHQLPGSRASAWAACARAQAIALQQTVLCMLSAAQASQC